MRADVGFAEPELCEALEKRGMKCAIRIPSNDTLEQAVAELLRRPPGVHYACQIGPSRCDQYAPGTRPAKEKPGLDYREG